MRSLISKGVSTFKNDGIAVFIDRTIKYSVVKVKRLTKGKDVPNIEKWKSLKNRYKGERIFLIGNGPSLNKTPLYLLQNEYTMAFNRFNLMFERLNWKPSFYMVTDDLVIKDMYQEINSEILQHVQCAFFPDLHPSNVNFKDFVENKANVYWLNTDKSEYRTDLPNCGINKTVVNAGMQIAAYMGFSEIYLIGVDMSFETQKVKKINSRNWEASEHDPNHFDPRYFGAGRKYHNPTVHEMIEKFEKGKKFFDNLGIKVFNAGVGGQLEVFPRKPFTSLFNYQDKEMRGMISNVKFLKENNLSFDDVLANSVSYDENGKYDQLNIFNVETDKAQAFIPQLIHTHIPMGPYQKQFYFVKKNSHIN